MKKRIAVSALIALTILFGPLGTLTAAELKIGIADTASILANSPEGKRAQEAIKRKAAELGRPLGTKRQDIQRQMETFQKQAGLMKEEARNAKAAELDKQTKDFQKQVVDADKQLAQFRQDQLRPLTNKLDRALEEVAKEQKLDLILDKSVVLINNNALDVTDRVRAKFAQ